MKKRSGKCYSRFILRGILRSDCRDLWIWRNHSEVRKNFFNSEPVSWQEHKKWFALKINEPQSRIYIAKMGKDKIGVMRFEVKSGIVKVSVNLNPDFFGQKLGRWIIKRGTEKFLREMKTTKPVIAEIQKDNIVSQKAFAKAGYEIIKEGKEKTIYEYSI